MIKNQKESDSGFIEFYDYINKNPYIKYTLKYGTKIIDCEYFGCAESENDLDLNNPAYEEYNELYFRINTTKAIDINYHNMPDEIYNDGKLIFKKLGNKIVSCVKK